MLEGLAGGDDRTAPKRGLPITGGALRADYLLPPAQPAGFDELTLTSERVGTVHSICVSGELDLASAPRLELELATVEATDATLIVVDLSNLIYIDSTGVRLLLSAHARSRTGSDRLTLLRASNGVQRVFELCGVADLLPFVD